MSSSDSQIDKPQRGRPKRVDLPDVNTNTGAQSINTDRAISSPCYPSFISLFLDPRRRKLAVILPIVFGLILMGIIIAVIRVVKRKRINTAAPINQPTTGALPHQTRSQLASRPGQQRAYYITARSPRSTSPTILDGVEHPIGSGRNATVSPSEPFVTLSWPPSSAHTPPGSTAGSEAPFSEEPSEPADFPARGFAWKADFSKQPPCQTFPQQA